MSTEVAKPVHWRVIIKTPEEFDRRVDEWVAECRASGTPLTWTGAALALGFKSRQSLWYYGKQPDFADSVKYVKLLVEHVYELRLHGNSPTGAIFGLKQCGWSDKTEVEHSGNVALDVRAIREKVEGRIAGMATRLVGAGDE